MWVDGIGKFTWMEIGTWNEPPGMWIFNSYSPCAWNEDTIFTLLKVDNWSVSPREGAMEFFLNVFTEFRKFSDENICHYSKRSRKCHLLCKRPGCYQSASKTHVKDRIFKFMPQWFIRFPEFDEFSEFNESPAPFKENSNKSVKTLEYLVWIIAHSTGV